MTDWQGEYRDAVFAAFSEPAKEDRIKAFRSAMEKRIEGFAREQIATIDTCAVHAIRGAMRICIELMDGAEAALNSDGGEANADEEDGNPI